MMGVTLLRHRARPAALALVFMTIAAGLAHAGAQRVALSASLASNYDSNILEYASDAITVFESGTRPDRFSLVSTDDVVWNPGLALAWELAGQRGRRRVLRLWANGNFHQKNGTADFRSAGFAWHESWSRGRRLSVSCYRLPNFYLRQLLDEDYLPPYPGLSRYRRASFGLDIGSLDWMQAVGRGNTLRLGTQFEVRRYHVDFRDRDSHTGQGELAWGWTRLPRHGQFELRALYRRSQAKAEDGDEVAGGVPDDPDTRYHGLAAGTHGEVEFARRALSRLSGDADYQFSTRDFDSDRPADKFHFGRRDRLHTLELGIGARWNRAWRGRAFWHYERNRANLGVPVAITSVDTGDYSRSQLGIRLDWSGTLWHSKAAASASDE